jgi:hypothetical protein
MDNSQPASTDEIDLVKVVNRSAHIENLMNQIIEAFCAPRKKAASFMWLVLLDSSIMPMGSKMKVVATIANILGCEFERVNLNRLLSIRNVFAHNSTAGVPVIVFGANGEPGHGQSQFWTMDSLGAIKVEFRHELFREFNEKFDVVKASLLSLRDAVKKDVECSDMESMPSFNVPFTGVFKPKKQSKAKPKDKDSEPKDKI